MNSRISSFEHFCPSLQASKKLCLFAVGIKVLPSSLKKEYQDLMEANKFIKAESLKVSITRRRFASLISKEGIRRNVLAFQLLIKEVIKEQPYFIIDRKYDGELGLQLDVEEKNFDAMFF